MDLKKLVTSWYLWIMVVVAVAGIFLFGKESASTILPLLLILLCPLMMMFMMNDKHHKH